MSWFPFAAIVPVAVGALVAYASPASARDPQHPQAAQIMAANQQWLDAYGRDDMAALAQLYTEDARLLPEGSAAVIGRPDIVAYLAKLKAGGPATTLSFNNYEFYGDDLVVTEITDTEVRDATGKLKSRGKQILVFVKQAGEWKLHRDMWTRNGPLKADDR